MFLVAGKTFLINYFIMEFLKDNAQVFACDPKQSDLYALKRIMPKGHVARGDLSPLFNLIYMQTLRRFFSDCVVKTRKGKATKRNHTF